MSTPTPRRASRAVVALLFAVVALLAAAAPALGHASVRQTTPFDTERVEPGEVPDAVTIEFNENVEIPPGGIRVFDQDGQRVDVDGEVPAADAPDVGGRALGELDDGAYIVTWRAVSADGHPIKGAFVFTVGEADEASDSLVESVFGGDGGMVGPAQRLTTGATYIVVLFAAGALLAGGVLGAAASQRSAGWVRRAGVAGIALGVLAIPLQAMAVSGDGLSAALDGQQLATVLGASVGLAAVVRTIGLCAVVWARDPARRTMGGMIALGSFLIDGHTRTVEPLWLMMGADALHLVAGAVWFGGLVVLLRELRARRLADDPVGGARMLAGWSRLAVWSVAGVVVGGSALAYATVREPIALVTTTYGQLLQVKVLLALLVIGVGAWNHRRLVPRVQEAVVAVPAGDATTAATDTHGEGDQGQPVAVRTGLAWLRLRRTVRAEVVLLVGVLLVTGVLQNQRPAAEAVGIGGIYQTTEALTEDLDIDIVVDPNLAGENSIHLYLLDQTGRPHSEVESLSLSLSLPAQDIGPIEREPVVSGPGHWVQVGRELALPGTWDVTINVRIDRFTEVAVTVPVVVGSG